MTADKAKEIIDLNIKEAAKNMPPDVKEALQLASEAIVAILAWRIDWDPNRLFILPSETVD